MSFVGTGIGGRRSGGLVLEYYVLLRSILRSKPHLRRCLKRCRHCRIFLLTDPRNAGRKDESDVGRKDLGCPFGCSEAHSKEESTRRSVAYYQTKEGKKKKETLNQRRRGSVGGKPPFKPAKEAEAPTQAVCCRLPEPMVEHVRVVVSLIEGRPVSREEILEMLSKVLRQQGLARRRKVDHALRWLNENPP